MTCEKCGAKWSGMIDSQLTKCPFCGEILNENIPYSQAVNVLRMIVQRFGNDIYLEEKRLQGMVNDLLPNSIKEKDAIRNIISLGVPAVVLEAANNPDCCKEYLKNGYELAQENGLDTEWSSAAIFIFSYPLNLDSRAFYPLSKQIELSTNPKTQDLINRNIRVSTDVDYSDKAISELEDLSEQGDAEASLEIGFRYYSGIGVPQDYSKAIRYFRRAEALDNAEAQYNLGVMYDNAIGIEHDVDKAFEYYKKSAEQGLPQGQFSLGEMYYAGLGCEKNDQEAVYWLQKAEAESEYDDVDVLMTLATIYRDSKDSSVNNPKKAFEYTQKAIDAGSDLAYSIMGTLYENGWGVQQDYQKAFQYYSIAADKGEEMAFLSMGAYYLNGYGVQKDEKKAVECFQIGADSGNMYCLNALALCYNNGQGVPQDQKKAFDLFLKAAYAGNYASEYNVGLAYAEGQGVIKNEREAQKWFLLSADKGFGKAMYALGIYAENGIPDGEPNIEEALDWYLRSANAGDYADSQWILGNCRTYGLMNSYVDRLEGFEWYLKAAENGHPTAQNNVAVAYQDGVIVEQDYDKAVEWFEKSVAQEDQYALTNYGLALINGGGIRRNVNRGFEMLNKAAELGNTDAKMYLGVCYFEGWGTNRDLNQALKWLSEAFDEGNEEAVDYLEKGFKFKNGKWIKRGFFATVPDPEPLAQEETVSIPTKGCMDCCKYYMPDQSNGENGRSFCKKFNSEVFTKTKCPYYANKISSTVYDLGNLLIEQ